MAENRLLTSRSKALLPVYLRARLPQSTAILTALSHPFLFPYRAVQRQ
jgi:hypothetical protein